MVELTAERLRSLISYDAETGLFSWARRGGRSGSQCNREREPGHLNAASGYRAIRVDKKLYQAHRLAWLFVHGEWPHGDIDHINGNRLDNRIENLRDVDNQTNRENTNIARRDSGSGIQGVRFDDQRGRWAAKIRSYGHTYWLGYHDTAELAREAYLKAKSALHAGWVPAGNVEFEGSEVLQTGVVARCDSASGIRGVMPCGRGWRVKYRGKHIGVFADVAAAKTAYETARAG